MTEAVKCGEPPVTPGRKLKDLSPKQYWKWSPGVFWTWGRKCFPSPIPPPYEAHPLFIFLLPSQPFWLVWYFLYRTSKMPALLGLFKTWPSPHSHAFPSVLTIHFLLHPLSTSPSSLFWAHLLFSASHSTSDPENFISLPGRPVGKCVAAWQFSFSMGRVVPQPLPFLPRWCLPVPLLALGIPSLPFYPWSSWEWLSDRAHIWFGAGF